MKTRLRLLNNKYDQIPWQDVFNFGRFNYERQRINVNLHTDILYMINCD